MTDSNYSVCVKSAHQIDLSERLRNSLFWGLSQRHPLKNLASSKAIAFSERGIKFMDTCALHDLTVLDLDELLEARGFFSVGLSFTHPEKGTLIQSMVEFSSQTVIESIQTRGCCYEGYVEGLRICVEQFIVHSINGRSFFNVIDGKSVKIEAYTPLCFEPRQPRK